jgi:hypothetical protein
MYGDSRVRKVDRKSRVLPAKPVEISSGKDDCVFDFEFDFYFDPVLPIEGGFHSAIS